MHLHYFFPMFIKLSSFFLPTTMPKQKLSYDPKTHFEYNGRIWTKRPSTKVFFEEMKEAKLLSNSNATKIANKFLNEGWENFAAFETKGFADFAALDGVSAASAKKIAAHKLVIAAEGKPIRSFQEQIEMNKGHKYLLTRVHDLNRHLNDGQGLGFRSGTLIEFYGKPQMGKTQWMYDLAVRTMLPPEKGGWGQSVIYFDTEGAYNVNRILKCGLYWGLSEKDFEEKMYYVSPRVLSTGSDLVTHIEGLDSIIIEKDVGLIIIDSLIQPFKNEFKSVAGEHLSFMGKRQNLLGQALMRLKALAQSYKLIVCYTNQVIANIGGMNNQPKEIPVGGDTVGHASDLRFELKKDKSVEKSETRKMKLVDCGWLPTTITSFCLTPFGIVDPSEVKEVLKIAEALENRDPRDKTPILNHLGQPIMESKYLKFSNELEQSFKFPDLTTEDLAEGTP